MEEQMNTTQPVAPMATDTGVPSTPQNTPPTSSGTEYAGFFTRFVAGLIDGFLILGVVVLLGIVSGGFDESPVLNLVVTVGSWAYFVLMTSKYGATLGKMFFKLRVQKEDTGANLTIVDAILRELVGKFLSGLVLWLGYLWMLWDPKKQTWHDKIAKSVVVKVNK